MKHLYRLTVATVFFIMLANPIFGQATPDTTANQQQTSSEFYQATLHGERDAKGSGKYVCAGFCCGVFGCAAAIVSTQNPDPHLMVIISESKGDEYAMVYQQAYRKEAHKRNVRNALTGFLIGTGAWILILLSVL